MQNPKTFETDVGKEYGDEAVARYVAQALAPRVQIDAYRKQTYIWSGAVWEESPDHMALTRDVLVAYRLMVRNEAVEAKGNLTKKDWDALAKDGDWHALRLKQADSYKRAGNIQGIHSLTKSDPILQALPNQWDQDPFKLGTPTGTVDLRTGKLTDPDPADYITKLTAAEYVPDSKSEKWDQTLLEIMANNLEVVSYLQETFGYCATGTIDGASLMVFTGAGRNGKDTIVEAVTAALGQYAKPGPEGLLTLSSRGFERHRQEIREMDGFRLYPHSEVPTGAHLTEARCKQFTGSDFLTADSKGGPEVTFRNQTKHLLTVNEMPAYDLTDQAMAARMRVIPFSVTFRNPDEALPGEPVADPSLKGRLKQDAEVQTAILVWLVEGSVKYLERGHLEMPDVVRAATESYREGNLRPDDEDGILRWLNDVIVERNGEDTSLEQGLAFASYQNWLESNQVMAPITTIQTFGKVLKSHGLEAVRDTNATDADGKRNSIRVYEGLRLRSMDRETSRWLDTWIADQAASKNTPLENGKSDA